MILPDALIRDRLAGGGLVITPLGDDAVRPASVDLRLGPVIKVAQLQTGEPWRVYDLRDASYRLSRGDFVLGATLEWVEIPTNLVGVLAGKSSRAREGLIVESAGYVDPGWRGELTLEMTTLAPGVTTLYVGMPICQIRFEMLLVPAERPYGSDGTSHYQSSRGPVESHAVGVSR